MPKTLSGPQQFLKSRGVPYSGVKKATLEHLAELAAEINIEIDPDGLLEDREEVLRNKLNLLEDGESLPHPSSLTSTADLTASPGISMRAIYNYQLEAKSQYSAGELKQPHNSDAWQMMRDKFAYDTMYAEFVNT